MFIQSLSDPEFVQDPYTAYARARSQGPTLFWQDYGMLAAFDHATVHALLRDRRLGRQAPGGKSFPGHLADFDAVERHSLLELEPPRHTRLRSLVLRAFTSRRITHLTPDINEITGDALARFESGADLIPTFCQPIPVRVIARLMGVPESMAPDLLRWSTAMVAMYQANRTRAIEEAAADAAREFSDFLRAYVEERRTAPGDDLISHLIAAEEDGERLSADEMISTLILLLNAGHEATVHSLGNAIKTLLENQTPASALVPGAIEKTVEELLRFDPPLHVFTRYVYEPVGLGEHRLQPGDEVALVLGSASRDPERWSDPDRFDPTRDARQHVAFGGGLHFCIGAPLARLEMQVALPALFKAHRDLRLASAPQYSDSYHFHKLDELVVEI